MSDTASKTAAEKTLETARATSPSTQKAVSIFIIGTELTCGIIQDKHIPLLAGELTKLGYSIRRASIVPDDGTISHELEHAAADSDVIIVTGGLGPTCDDMTRQAIANLAGVPLERNETAWNEVYARLGQRIWGANERQAYIPRGFDEIPNPKGTAPGFKGSFSAIKTDVSEPAKPHNVHDVLVIAMPGPPGEMQHMFYNHIRPFLARISGCGDLGRDEFSVYMVPEAKLEELCEACAVEGVSWGTRFQPFKISLYVDGSCVESRKAFEKKLSAVIGCGLLERGEHEAVDLLSSYLEANALTISTAESATAGFASKMLTDRAGSSAWFWGGAATYANEAKAKVLYDYLDASRMFRGTVRKQDRSYMNVPFVTDSEELNKKFLAQAAEAGLVSLKGHRSVGGMRASLYNAMPLDGVKALVRFMEKFEKENG